MAEFQLNQSNWTTAFMPPIWLSSTKGCDLAFNGIINPILCVLGFLTSLLTIFGLRRVPEKDNGTIWLLKTLALLDNIYILLVFVFTSISTITGHTGWISETLTMYTRIILQPLVLFAHSLITWVLVLVTVDRYLAVCKPMDIKWRDLRRVKAAVKWLVVLAAVLHAPCFCEEALKSYHRVRCIDANNTVHNTCLTIGHLSNALWIFNRVSYSVFTSFVPLIILMILNVRIASVLRALMKKRRQMSRQINSERSLTKTLVAVVAVFVVCQMPERAFHIIHIAGVVADDELFCAMGITHALNNLNSSLNFIIYYLSNRRLKRIFSGMLPCHLRQRTVVLVV